MFLIHFITSSIKFSLLITSSAASDVYKRQAVVNGLGLKELKIGKEIAHGVPALWSPNSNCNKPVSVTLKSGNFGQADFFKRALRILRGKT